MKFKTATLSIILVILMVLGTACGGGGNASQPANNNNQASNNQPSGKATVIKLAHMSPELPDDAYHMFALRYKEAIESKTNGRFEVELYPAGVLGKDRELAEGLQYGTVDLAVITSSPMGNFVPAFQTLDLPFLFDSWEHVYRFLESDAAEELYKETESAGIITFGLIARGPRSVTNSGKAIESVEGLKGMKIRVIESSIFVDTFTALGAAPQAMSWGEVFTALQQGTIDGHENSIATINNERVYEVQDNVSLTEHIFAFTTAHASKMFWDTLSAEDQKLFKETAKEITIQISKEQEKAEEDFLGRLKAAGMNIYEIDRAPMREMVDSVYEKFAKSNTDKYFKAIEELK
ncbi:TRAP transporter substrate-binding protein [Sedimentibacter sp.]|uniref:TRAP transporter substrate-binding protein n=1 Tax=Sedimentibacter sp. TaxID=1960295 RepID=UPI0028A90BB2|nr:TRAP transporter substrate-binding protein [Sedimentibacter sp.]